MLGGYRDSSGGGRASGGTTGFGQPAIPAFAIGAVERLIGSAGVIGSSKIFARLKLAIPFSEAMSLRPPPAVRFAFASSMVPSLACRTARAWC